MTVEDIGEYMREGPASNEPDAPALATTLRMNIPRSSLRYLLIHRLNLHYWEKRHSFLEPVKRHQRIRKCSIEMDRALHMQIRGRPRALRSRQRIWGVGRVHLTRVILTILIMNWRGTMTFVSRSPTTERGVIARRLICGRATRARLCRIATWLLWHVLQQAEEPHDFR